MKKVFILYRREDTQAIAGRLHDGLEAGLGRGSVFLDVDSIPLGANFRDHISTTIDACSVFLLSDRNAMGFGEPGRKAAARRT